MDYATLERIVKKSHDLAAQAIANRDKATNPVIRSGALNQAVGIDQVLRILAEEFPDQMAQITAGEAAQIAE